MGQKYAAYNTAGAITGFYDDVDSPVPAGVTTIAIADEEWLTCINSSVPYTIASGALVAPTSVQLLAVAKSNQIQILRSACSDAIVAGYSSSALGAAYTYPSTAQDQANQSDAFAASLAPSLATDWSTPLWCEDSSGTWAMVNHTAAQVQQLNADWLSFRVAAQQKYATLATSVSAATTIAAVQVITWATATS